MSEPSSNVFASRRPSRERRRESGSPLKLRERLVPNPKLRLLDQCREVMRFKQMAARTEESYCGWIKRFVFFCRDRNPTAHAPHPRPLSPSDAERVAAGWRHPRECGGAEVRAFLTHLAAERGVSASTQNQALSALVFLYQEVIGGELEWLDGFERSQRGARVPVVLSKEETACVLGKLEGTYRLIGQLLYGTGMRLLEGLRLRVKDVDFARAAEGKRSTFNAQHSTD